MPSDLQVSNIKANDGTAGISIADSTGNITLNNPITSGTFNGTIGTSASGSGLTAGMELWRLNTNITNDDNPLGQSGGEWSIGTGNDTNTGVDSYGTGLVSESNGTFTINENGYFFITANLQVVESATAHAFLVIKVSDNSSTGYESIGKAYAITESATNAVANAQVNALIKITGSAPYNHKYLRLNYDTNDGTMFANGGPDTNETYIIFHKISDV